MGERLLLIENGHRLRSQLCCYLSTRGYDVSLASEGGEAVRLLDAKPFDLVVTDLHLPDMNGAVLVSHIRCFAPTTLVMVVSKHAELNEILGLLRKGVYAYLEKPFQFPVLEHRIRRALKTRCQLFRQLGERWESQRDYDYQDHMVNRTYLSDSFPKLAETYRADKCILIRGEEGSGKRMLARFLYLSNQRTFTEFVRLNAKGLSYGQVQTNLQKINAKSKNGRCDTRPGQSILLLENLELAPQQLDRLLSQLVRNENTVSYKHPVGIWHRVIITTTDTRVCRAQNETRFLDSQRVSLINLKPLRERMEDLPSIADYLLAHSRRTFLKPVMGLETDAMRCLLSHTWPGNIEELRLALDEGVKSCKTKYIGLLDLPVYLQRSQGVAAAGSGLH